MFEITYKDGRKCFYHQTIGIPTPFAVYVDNGTECEAHVCGEEFWYSFAKALMDFFDTGVSKVDVKDTLSWETKNSLSNCSYVIPYLYG